MYRLSSPTFGSKHSLTGAAEAYAVALADFFSHPIPLILDKGSLVSIKPFEVFEEDERTRSVAMKWKENWRAGRAAQEIGTPEALNRALQLFTLSARSFPDSWVAGDCHTRRAQILDILGRREEASVERLRGEEHYVPLELEFGVRE